MENVPMDILRHFQNSSVFRFVLTNVMDPVLRECSYGPWDHFLFSVKKWIRLVFLAVRYSFFEGNDRFAAQSESEITAFYLTDFLVRQFDAFVIKPMGLDQHPELRDMYFGNYDKLVYQAQTDDPALTRKAQRAADQLGLAFERRVTGYGDLETTLKQL